MQKPELPLTRAGLGGLCLEVLGGGGDQSRKQPLGIISDGLAVQEPPADSTTQAPQVRAGVGWVRGWSGVAWECSHQLT